MFRRKSNVKFYIVLDLLIFILLLISVKELVMSLRYNNNKYIPIINDTIVQEIIEPDGSLIIGGNAARDYIQDFTLKSFSPNPSDPDTPATHGEDSKVALNYVNYVSLKIYSSLTFKGYSPSYQRGNYVIESKNYYLPVDITLDPSGVNDGLEQSSTTSIEITFPGNTFQYTYNQLEGKYYWKWRNNISYTNFTSNTPQIRVELVKIDQGYRYNVRHVSSGVIISFWDISVQDLIDFIKSEKVIIRSSYTTYYDATIRTTLVYTCNKVLSYNESEVNL